jgi:hypothetical protein
MIPTTQDVAQVCGDLSNLSNRTDRIDTRTNDWNTAYSWGDHAGLYLGLSAWGTASNDLWQAIGNRLETSVFSGWTNTQHSLNTNYSARIIELENRPVSDTNLAAIVTQATNDISSLIGDITKSYVIYNYSNTYSYAGIYQGRPFYTNGVDSLYCEPADGWSIGNPYAHNNTESKIPPYDGWVDEDGDPLIVVVEFHQGTIADEEAARVAGDALAIKGATIAGGAVTAITTNAGVLAITVVSNDTAKVDKAGDTLTGSLRTTVDQLTTAPASDELATAAWTRSLLDFGTTIYMTTNMYPAQWSPTNTTGIGSRETQPSNTLTFSVGAVGSYIATMVDTTPVSADAPLKGPATVHIHLRISAGSPAANYSLSAKPEIYYTYSLAATNLSLGDFSADPQTWTSGQNEGKSFALAWDTAHPTGTYYRVYRLKVAAKGSAITNCSMGVGGVDASYVTYDSSGEDVVLLLGQKANLSDLSTVSNIAAAAQATANSNTTELATKASTNDLTALATNTYTIAEIAQLLAGKLGTNGDISGLSGLLAAGSLGTNSDRTVGSLTAARSVTASNLVGDGTSVTSIYKHAVLRFSPATVAAGNPINTFYGDVPAHVKVVDIMGIMWTGTNSSVYPPTNCSIRMVESKLDTTFGTTVQVYFIPTNIISPGVFGVYGDGVTPLASLTNSARTQGVSYGFLNFQLINGTTVSLTNMGAFVPIRFKMN